MSIELEEGEKLIREAHRHWFVIFKSAVALVIAALIPLAFLVATGVVTEISGETIANAAPPALFLYSIWLLALWMFFFIEWTDYYLDLWYVTDRRVIVVNQKGFFNREVISLRFDNIQNVEIDVGGVIATLLKFGDIHVQTAGTNEKMGLMDTANAVIVKNHILELQQKAKTAPQKVEVVSD